MKITLPALGVALVDGSGQMTKEWRDKIKFMEQLQPLSDLPPAAANVSSIDGATGAITITYPLARTGQQLRGALTSGFAALGADVALNNTANYFDGPSVTLGTGTWFVTGTVTCIDTASTSRTDCKLWDGTTVISSTSILMTNTARGLPGSMSGIITNPAGNVRISCRNPTVTSGAILFNQSGNSMDSHITAVRLA